MSSNQLNIGIFLPSNNQSGPQKLAALCANDLSRHKYHVHIFIPRLPYFYNFVVLQKAPLFWLRNYVLHELANYLRDRSFVFEELLQPDVVSKNVKLHNVWRRPTRRHLAGMDYVFVMTISQVFELQSIFPQEKTIYYLLHPEEIASGHEQTIQTARSNFKGKIIALSPWTARQVSDHVRESTVVPSAVSPLFWENRFKAETVERDKDILFHFSLGFNKGGDKGVELIKALRKVRPNTKVTVWTRDGFPDLPHAPIEKSVSEGRLRELYLSHKMLLFPSTLEGFGMPPIEGMACGCIPILYPGVGGADLYARDGENAILLLDEIKQSAQRIASLLDDSERMRKMRATISVSIEPFSPEGYGMRLLEAAGIKD